MNPFRGLVAPTLLRDVLSGEALAWTADDWLAAVKLLRVDVKVALARVLLASSLRDSLVYEVLIRREIRAARKTGCAVYCLYHGSDVRECPAGSHDESA